MRSRASVCHSTAPTRRHRGGRLAANVRYLVPASCKRRDANAAPPSHIPGQRIARVAPVTGLLEYQRRPAEPTARPIKAWDPMLGMGASTARPSGPAGARAAVRGGAMVWWRYTATVRTSWSTWWGRRRSALHMHSNAFAPPPFSPMLYIRMRS